VSDTYFSADHHFFHENIIGYVSRQVADWGRLFANAEEMNVTMIKRWNERVDHKDTIYVLGDFAFARGEQVWGLFAQLKGVIKIVPGGHDMRWLKDMGHTDRGQVKSGFVSGMGKKVEILPQLYHLKMGKGSGYPKIIALCHYPFFTWEQSHHGSWNLHGHSHGGLGRLNRYQKIVKSPPTTLEDGHSMDVGVDTNDFYPWSLSEIALILRKEVAH